MGLIGVLEANFQVGVILIVTLVFSLSFHEFAHAYMAYRLGDHTAAYQGRLTLNPLAHLDPMGSLMMLFIGFGYAKPVPVNPVNLNNPRIGMMKVAFAGPASNLFLALIASFLFRFFDFGGILNVFIPYFVFYNILLALFNLIPLLPLDGGQIFSGFLDKANPKLSYNLRQYSSQILFAIIIISFISRYITEQGWINMSQLDIIGNCLFEPCRFLTIGLLGS